MPKLDLSSDRLMTDDLVGLLSVRVVRLLDDSAVVDAFADLDCFDGFDDLLTERATWFLLAGAVW